MKIENKLISVSLDQLKVITVTTVIKIETKEKRKGYILVDNSGDFFKLPIGYFEPFTTGEFSKIKYKDIWVPVNH